MKRIYILLFALIFAYSIPSFSQNKFYHNINNKNMKVIDTESFKINNDSSIHVVLAKNKNDKNYVLIPFLVNEDTLNKLPKISFDKEPKTVSAHFTNDKWIYIYKENNKDDLHILQYALTGENSINRKILNKVEYDHSLQSDDTAYFLDFEKNGNIKLYTIKDFDNIFLKTFSPANNKSNEDYRTIMNKAVFYSSNDIKSGFDFVTTTDYVNIGSIKNGHTFLYDDTIFLSYDLKSDETSYVIKLDLNNLKENSQYVVNQLHSSLGNTRQIRSFITDNKLFQFGVDFEFAKLHVFDLNTGESLNSYTYTKENFGPYNKYYFKTEEIEPKPERFFNSFRKMRIGSTYLPTIFIVVNKGHDNSYIVETGHINGATYSYNNYYMDHFWWMHQINSIPTFHGAPGFGPNPSLFQPEITQSDDESLRKTSFMLALDHTLQKLDSIPKSIYTKDKWKEEKKELEELTKNTSFESLSSATLENEINYIYYDKSKKQIFIKSKTKK